MLVRVRLFAMLRERAGAREIELELPDGAQVSDALAAMSQLGDGLPLVMAVNRVYVRADAVLSPGDELALIPPVSGGEEDGGDQKDATLHARVSDQPLRLDELVARVTDPRAGAVVIFQGVTRTVARLEYEAYSEMAEAQMAAIVVAAEHRVGAVALSEPSVAVAVSAPHRGEAFAGAREIIDAIKAQAPIWKKEIEGGQATWVPGTPPR